MSRKKSKVVPEGNDLVPQDTSGLGEITMEELRRIIFEATDKSFEKLVKQLDRMPELTGMLLRATNQHLAGLEHEAWQLRLVMETDVTHTPRVAIVRRTLQQIE